MRHALVAALVLVSSCTRGPAWFQRAPSASSAITRARELASGGRFDDADRLLAQHIAQPPTTAGTAEAHYWRGVINLDPANESGKLDVALASLEAYLASGGKLEHLPEAAALRRLARNAQQLARVESALQQARADRPRAEPDAKTRDEEALKEIQRLKDELAKANAELERIKKRLAAPKP